MSEEYRYTECGLDYVVLVGLRATVDDAGEEVCTIPNVAGLHRLIAKCIVTHGHSISPDELRFLRTEIGLTQAELGRLVKKDHQTIGRWERGEKPIDPNAELVIRLFAVEKLGLDAELDVEEMARRCVPSASVEPIEIDASHPEDYRPIAA